MSKAPLTLLAACAAFGNTPALQREPEPYHRKSTIAKDLRKARTKHKKAVKKGKRKH